MLAATLLCIHVSCMCCPLHFMYGTGMRLHACWLRGCSEVFAYLQMPESPFDDLLSSSEPRASAQGAHDGQVCSRSAGSRLMLWRHGPAEQLCCDFHCRQVQAVSWCQPEGRFADCVRYLAQQQACCRRFSDQAISQQACTRNMLITLVLQCRLEGMRQHSTWARPRWLASLQQTSVVSQVATPLQRLSRPPSL